jgi:spermidine/putrescine transport system permease protein
MNEKRKTFFLFLIALPFFISLIVRLYAWVLILRPTGFLNQVLLWSGIISERLEIIYTDLAVIIGMTYIFIPFMFLPLYASIEKLDLSLIEVSSDLGATRFQTFVRVLLPMTMPGVIGGSIIVFIPALGNFIVPSVLGGAKVLMIGNLIEQQFLSARNWPFGSALGMIVMVAILVLLIYYVRLMTRGEKSINTPAVQESK